MAKKKKSDLDTDLNITDAIIAEFGEIVHTASSLQDNRPITIPTTPKMDLMLSGGIPEGSFVVITGPPGLGKSAAALHIAGNAQKIDSEFGSREVFYLDIEGRLKERDVFMNLNLDSSPEKFKLIRSSRSKIMSGEEFMDVGEKLVRHKPGSVIIFDSFSALCTSSRQEGAMGSRFRDDAPSMLSDFCKRINQMIPVNKSIVIGITHRIANQGGGIRKWNEASGEKIQYQADVKLKGTYQTAWLIGTDQIGQDVHWECEKSALGPPHKTCICKLRYRHGYDEVSEVVDLCVEFGLVKKRGSWFRIDNEKEGGEEVKFQGIEKFIAAVKESPKLLEELKAKIKTELFESYENEEELEVVANDEVQES